MIEHELKRIADALEIIAQQKQSSAPPMTNREETIPATTQQPPQPQNRAIQSSSGTAQPFEPQSPPSVQNFNQDELQESQETQEIQQPKKQIVFQDVADAFGEFIIRNGRDAAIQLMQRYGVKGKLTKESLPPVLYGHFYDDCQK